VKRFVSLQFLDLRESVGLLGRGISPSQGRYLTQISMPQVGFEPMIPVFERAKAVYAVDRAATDQHSSYNCIFTLLLPYSIVHGLRSAVFQFKKLILLI
jgi:hypothetical protein